MMKIVYTCSYAYPSISGVWTRVENLAKELIKQGHEIHVLTSNIIAGTDKTVKPYERYEGIHIHRFPVKKKLTKYQLLFTGKKFNKTLEKINPDIIDTQTYRHPEGKKALEWGIKNNVPVILTTHAPFLPVEVRGRFLSILAKGYDFLIGKRILKKYSKIFRISKWEEKYLINLGVNPKKIVFSPNGVPKIFFKTKNKKIRNKTILFLGRIEPRKEVHTLIKSFVEVLKKYPKAELKIVGPIENISGYKEKLKDLINKYNLKNRVSFLGPVYDLKKKIEIIQNSQVYILPSKWEGFPQSLIEAMSLGNCVIGSNCDGNKETIEDGKTGFLFEIGDDKELAEKINFCFSKDTSKIEKKAGNLSENFQWKNISENVEKEYKKAIAEH